MASIALLRVVLAVLVIAVLLPWLMFPRLDEPEANPLVSRALWMAFLATVVVHGLAGMRIYEAPVFLVICLLVAMRSRLYAVSEQGRIQLRIRAVGWFYDRVDRKPLPEAPDPKVRPALTRRPGSWQAASAVLVGAEFAAVAVVLFAKAFQTPVPPLSDAPVNLAWLKYMENYVLYHDEVYPRGMYAVLSLVRKFTWLNGVVLLDLVGPLISLTIVAAMAFFVRKTTRSWGAVVVAVALYGLFPQFLPTLLGRRGAPNSEEYGLVFVLPAAWFLYAFLVHGRRGDRTSAAAAAGVAAFTHPFPALFAIAMMGGSTVAAVVYRWRAAWRRLPGAIVWVGGAGAIAVTPPLTALLLGEHWHASSLQYLGAGTGSLPVANPLHLGALALSGIFALVLPLAGRRFGPDAADLGAAAAVAGTGLAVYLAPYLGLNSGALFDRGGEIGAISLAVLAGLLWALVERLLGRLRPAGILAAVLAVGLVWHQTPPAGPELYYYYTTDMIQTYLRAAATYTPGTWTLVTGFRGYALALGQAVHMYPNDFILMASQMPGDVGEWYDASWRLADGQTMKAKTPHFVFMVEKVSPAQDSAQAAPTLVDGQKLAQWISSAAGKLPLRPILSDANMDVWTLDLPVPEKSESIFNPKKGPAGSIGR